MPFHIHYQDYFTEALEIVSSWDVPDEDFARAVNDQARLAAGIDPDERRESITG
jgi:hypothetical protein